MFFHDELLLLSDTALSSQLKADGIVTNADFDVRKSKISAAHAQGEGGSTMLRKMGMAPRSQSAGGHHQPRTPEIGAQRRGTEWFSEDDP